MNDFILCLQRAREIVQRVKNEWPGCEDAKMLEVGGSSGSSDSAFSRKGTTVGKRSYELPANLFNSLTDAFEQSGPDAATDDAQKGLFSSLMSRSASAVPAGATLTDVDNITPEAFSGDSALNTIMARNPYSTDYENSTADLYNRVFGEARARALSGPANVRGGQARQGFELADLGTQQSLNQFREIRGQQDKEAGVVNDAVRTFNTIESMRRGSQLQSQSQRQASESARTSESLQAAAGNDRLRASHLGNLHLAAELLGVPTTTQNEDLAGQGSQSSSGQNFSAGLTCCFIFLQSLNGVLPWYVRRGRDDFNTTNRRSGYRFMSAWVIPLMQRWHLCQILINVCLVKPFLRWGRALYITNKPSPWKPVCYFWFHVWSFLGWCRGGKG